MISLFKKKWKRVDVNAVIAEIHQQFDSATDRLLKEANDIIKRELDLKGKRLQNLGFVSSKSAIQFNEVEKDKIKKKELSDIINYYSVHYPNNKFITEAEVSKICDKYNLLYADVKYYKGDIPDKNLIEIENFNLRDEEMQKRTNHDDWYDTMRMMRGLNLNAIETVRSFEFRQKKEVYPSERKEYLVKPNFIICAPKNDFDTKNLVINGRKLEIHIPDPIVLQPVKLGYLIVSKWGLEGQDELVVNEKMN